MFGSVRYETTQQKMADKLGIDRSYISDMVRQVVGFAYLTLW